MVSRIDDTTKQTTSRLHKDLADDAETVARVQGTSVNQLTVDSPSGGARACPRRQDFTSRAKRLLARDKEQLDRLAK